MVFPSKHAEPKSMTLTSDHTPRRLPFCLGGSVDDVVGAVDEVTAAAVVVKEAECTKGSSTIDSLTEPVEESSLICE